MNKTQEKRIRRHKKVRAKIYGTAKVPRLCVFRSAKHIYAQMINDTKGETLIEADDFEIKTKKTTREGAVGKITQASEVGKIIARKAKEKKIEKIVFDRGGYKYQGRVKALADGAREEGLKF